MKRHAALRDAKQKQGVVQQALKAIEKNITEAPAQHDTQHGVKKKIPDLLGTPAPPLAVLRQPVAAGPEKQESQQVHYPVPMHLKRAC